MNLDVFLKKKQDLFQEYNYLMSEKQKKMSRVLNYFEHFLAFVSSVSSCVLTSAFASLIGVTVATENSTVRLKIFGINTGIIKC